MREGRPMVVAKNEQEEAGCLRRVAIAEVSLAPSLSVQLADCKQPTSRESGSEEPI